MEKIEIKQKGCSALGFEDNVVTYAVIKDGNWHGNKNIEPKSLNNGNNKQWEFNGVVLERIGVVGKISQHQLKRSVTYAFQQYKANK